MDLLKEAAALDFKAIITGIFTIIGATLIIIETLKKLCKTFGIESKWLNRSNRDHESIKKSVERIDNIEKYQKLNYKSIKEMSTTLNSMMSNLDEIKKQNDCMNDALIETMADRLNQKCQSYINDSQGIPEDEVEDFVRYFKNYTEIGGNHGLARKVNYCLDKLPILPSVFPKE